MSLDYMPLDYTQEFFSSAAFEDPYPNYARLCEIGPVCALADTGAYFVNTRAAVEEAVKRHQEFSANLEAVLVCGDDLHPRIHELAVSGAASNVIATADEPYHSVHRRLMLPPLKPAAIAQLELDMRVFAKARVEHLVAQGGGDSCAQLTEPVPAYVVTRLLDLGGDALELVRRWAMMGGDLLAGRLEEAQLVELLSEAAAQGMYLWNHLEAIRSRAPSERGASLTATLAAGIDEGLISFEQAVGISVVLFGAAGESTASLIGSAVKMLASDADLQARLRSAPDLIPAFVEEMVRLESPFKFHYRRVRVATDLCGTALREGDLLLLGWAAANRDPHVWDEPAELRLDRPSAQRHLGFGYGIHYCIGAPLARLEARVVLEELLAGTNHITIDATQLSKYVPSIFIRRLRQLWLHVS